MDQSRARKWSSFHRSVATFAGAHSFACGYAVRSVKRRTCGLPDRKATFAGAHSNSLRSLLSVFSANRLAALRKKRQRSLRAHSSACGYAVRSVKRCTCGLPDRKATFAGAHSSAYGYAVQPAMRIALRLSGQNGNGLKSCGSHMGLSAICSANRDKSPSEANRSDEGALRTGVFQQ